MTKRAWTWGWAWGLGALVASCGAPGAPLSTFALRFEATDDGTAVGCTSTIDGLGDGTVRVAPSDLRFYVSHVRFYDATGAELPVELDQNAFQYAGARGQVSLIDLTGTSEGTCTGTGISFAEGTARTNAVITGRTRTADVARVSFEVGVPQLLMKDTIAATTPEAASSPLDEMYWSWAAGYRHFVFNFTVETSAGAGEGYLHVGSRDCGPDDGLALQDRDACTYVNTPAVSIDDFDLERDTVAVDLRALLQGVDFLAPIRDPNTFEEIGQGPGVECHSSPTQPDCAIVLSRLGVDEASGHSNAATNTVFHRR